MATGDGSLRTPGTGETIATNVISDGGVANGQKAQRVKLGVGADGHYADLIPPADGNTSAETLGAGAMLWDSSSSAWKLARNAKSATDAEDGSAAQQVHPVLYNGSTYDRARSGVDGLSSGVTAVSPMLYDETSGDTYLQRGNIQRNLLALAARTTSTSAAVQTNHNARILLVNLQITVASGTGGLYFQYYCNLGAGSPLMWGSDTAHTTVGKYLYAFGPGLHDETPPEPSPANWVTQASIPVPNSLYFGVVAGDNSSYTYQLDAAFCL